MVRMVGIAFLILCCCAQPTTSGESTEAGHSTEPVAGQLLTREAFKEAAILAGPSVFGVECAA